MRKNTRRNDTQMNIALRIAQGMLAFVFLVSGFYKISHSKEALVSKGQTGVKFFPTAFIRFIALSELCGVAGLLAPGMSGIAPYLTPFAALGLFVIVLGATFCHARLAAEWEDLALRRKEFFNVVTTISIFLLCLFVAVGRAAEIYATTLYCIR